MGYNALLGSKYRFDAESGRAINTDHQRIAQVINDYNSELTLCWIPPENRSAEDVYAYAIIHTPSNAPEYIVRLIKEDELNASLVAWLFSHDQENVDTLSQIETYENAKQLLDYQKEMDAAEERQDLAESMLRSPLHVYRHNGKVHKG